LAGGGGAVAEPPRLGALGVISDEDHDLPRTLVTGPTGFLGAHVTRLLVERGDDVRALVRPTSDLRALDGLELETVTGDVCDRRAIRRALRGVGRVFHVAGTTNLRLSRAATFALNVEGTRIVLEEALRAGVERVTHTSSVAAIGPARKGSVATETNVWDAARYRIPYVDSKREAETVALGLAERGLVVVMVNPAHVLGAGDPGRSSTVLVQRFLRRQIPAYVDGTLNVVGVEDVARGHLLADERGAPGQRYILGNRNFTLDRLFNDLARLSGVEPPSVKLPLPVALALARAGQPIAGGWMPTPAEIRAASLHWAFSSAKAKRELGWRTSPHEDCLEETIAWYREREAERVAPPGSRQPVALRLAGAVVRRSPLGWR
jgi:dihydroflavonol-4-reductase